MEMYMELSDPTTEKILWGLLAGSGVCVVYLLALYIRIVRCRRRLEDYIGFIRETYIRHGDRIPTLILRHYRQDVDAYNALAAKCCCRIFWKQADSEILLTRVSDSECENQESEKIR